MDPLLLVETIAMVHGFGGGRNCHHTAGNSEKFVMQDIMDDVVIIGGNTNCTTPTKTTTTVSALLANSAVGSASVDGPKKDAFLRSLTLRVAAADGKIVFFFSFYFFILDTIVDRKDKEYDNVVVLYYVQDDECSN
jgi:hypothetical protein